VFINRLEGKEFGGLVEAGTPWIIGRETVGGGAWRTSMAFLPFRCFFEGEDITINDINLKPYQNALLDSRPISFERKRCFAHIVAEGIRGTNFTVGTGRFFERAYAHDLTGAAWMQDKWRPPMRRWGGRVQVQLSRPGLYDRFPRLFFQPAGAEYIGDGGDRDGGALSLDRNRENGIRQFFHPFEHAGFYQLLQLEEGRTGVVRGLGTDLHRYFRDFWEIPAEVDAVTAGIFHLLIPHAYRITAMLR